MDRWSRLLPQTRRRVRRLFTDPGSCGWLRDRRQREREGGGRSGWLAGASQTQPMFCDWSEFDRGKGLVCFPSDLSPGAWPISSSPFPWLRVVRSAQPVASCQGAGKWQRRRRPRRLQVTAAPSSRVSGFSLARDRKVSSSFGVTRRLRYVTLCKRTL